MYSSNINKWVFLISIYFTRGYSLNYISHVRDGFYQRIVADTYVLASQNGASSYDKNRGINTAIIVYLVQPKITYVWGIKYIFNPLWNERYKEVTRN